MRTHLLVALLVIGMIAVPGLPRAHAASGTYFDNIVVVAMENQNYADVMGTGTGSSNAPFIASMLTAGATIPLYHGYGAAGRSINGARQVVTPPRSRGLTRASLMATVVASTLRP